jgi:8-hydroxy-5-deazaflavin:NADPH oxidoreductase
MTAIAVLGTGNIGATLAGKWTAAGHQVTLASRNPDAPALRDLAASIGARTATHADAVRDAEVVVVALPGDAVAAMAAALGDAIDGNVVIDATNNLGPAEMNSIATIVRHAPGAVCARAFNSLGGENLADPDFDGTQADLLWCGPDGDPGALVERLITDVGLRPVRVGGLDQLSSVRPFDRPRSFATHRLVGDGRRPSSGTGSALFLAGATANWLHGVGDHFAERSLSWKLLAASSIGHIMGIIVVIAGVTTGI